MPSGIRFSDGMIDITRSCPANTSRAPGIAFGDRCVLASVIGACDEAAEQGGDLGRRSSDGRRSGF